MTGIEKDNRAMLKASLDFARRPVVLFGAAKFAAGLIIGFGLGVYFLPILTAKEGLGEASFLAIKDRAVQIAEINAFTNFSVMVPAHVDVSAFPAVLIWCEAFGEFITAAELS